MHDISKTIYRTEWVDVAKFFAIFAVLIDHTSGRLYNNSSISYVSYCSVSLFILMLGITSYWSYDHKDEKKSTTVIRRCRKIIPPYILASFIYTVFDDHYFDFETYINHVIRFNASTPFYYVLLYIKMTIVAPFFFYLIKKLESTKFELYCEVLVFVIVGFIAALTTEYSNILSIYGGGGKLLGGTYLILLYVGMWGGKHIKKLTITNMHAIVLFPISMAAMLLWWYFVANDQCQLDTYFPFGVGVNPPGVSLMINATFVSLTVFLLEEILRRSKGKIANKIFHSIAYFGQHTLYIFLYHRLFLDYIIPHLENKGLRVDNIWGRRIEYFVIMIGGSILIEYLVSQLKSAFREAYT